MQALPLAQTRGAVADRRDAAAAAAGRRAALPLPAADRALGAALAALAHAALLQRQRRGCGIPQTRLITCPAPLLLSAADRALGAALAALAHAALLQCQRRGCGCPHTPELTI